VSTDNHLQCPGCGITLLVRHQSWLDPIPQARDIVRSMFNGNRQEDGSILTIADDSGLIRCPECGVAAGSFT
jgi:predicted RNA-binding Zn-ribbon protein involved in translation (DUF1610 family)